MIYFFKITQSALNNHGLTPDDIDFVVSTHGHPDHCGNNNLFTKAQHIFGFHVFKGDVYVFHDFVEVTYFFFIYCKQ